MKIVYEKILPAAGSSFAILQKRARAFDGRYHFHPEVEITLIESSSGRRVVGDSIESFKPGDLVLLGQNLPHQYVSDPTARDEPAVAKVIQFSIDLIGDPLVRLPELQPIATMLKQAARGLKFTRNTTDDAVAIIRRLFEASDARRLLLLLELLDVLSRGRATPIASAGYVAKISTREGDAIDRALQYLNRNFHEPVTLNDVCRHLHVSPASCNRLFQKSIRRSFKSSLLEVRISHACRLLLETEQSISDIAYASGFSNLSNFNRRFKERKRHTPRTYRKLATPGRLRLV